MSAPIADWEFRRAVKATEKIRKILTEGTSVADELPKLLDTLDPSGDPNFRRVVYAMLGSLDVVEPYSAEFAFQNNWADLGDPVFSDYLGVRLDPFGRVQWRGDVGRVSGSAANGEIICTFPAQYSPEKLLGRVCRTNSGLIHIGIFPEGYLGLPARLIWRTTGGFTGGFASVDVSGISYDARK